MSHYPIFALCLLLACIPAQAFDLNEAEQQALASDPQLKALAAEVRAFEAEAIAAGQLPDPQLTFGVMNVPVPDLSMTAEPMASAQVGIMQRFPARARRNAQSGIKLSQAETVRARQDARIVEVQREVRRLWVMIQREKAMLALVEQKAEVLEHLTETLDDRLEVDLALQTAVLSSRARRARLEKTLSDYRARLHRARAALGELLDPHPLPAKLASADLAPPGSINIDDHPALTVALLGLNEAEERIGLADAGFRPGWSLSVGVSQRSGNVPMGAPSDTLVNATVAIDLPLFTRKRQSRDLEAARERFDAAATRPVEVRRRLAAEYRSARDTHAEFADMLAAYMESVLPLSRDQEEAAELRYRSGRGQLEAVLEARLARIDTEIELEQLHLARDQAAVELLYLGAH